MSEDSVVREVFCRVDELSLMGKDVYRVKLVSDELASIPYRGGQYLTLQVDGGRWIPFSIGNAPEETSHIELHIRLIPGHELAEHIIERLRKTQKAHIQLPLGRCTLRSSSRPWVCIVGGTGFSPIKAMIESYLAQNIDRECHLFWGAQTEADFYLKSLPEQWQKQHKQFSFTPVVSGDDDKWKGEIGMVHHAAIRELGELSGYDYYLSGSEAMVMAVYDDLMDKGVPKAQIYSDMLDIKRDMGDDV